jgi:uncharacterized secreted protein with C-terminal beta-propeller domain
MYDTVVPYLKEDGRTHVLPLGITYFDMPYTKVGLTQVHGINVDRPNNIESSQYLLSGDQNIYVPHDNIYISCQDYQYWFTFSEENEIAENLVAENDLHEKTIIHRIEINKGQSDLVASKTIPGNVLNQFSMSEHKKYLRIATTSGNNWNGTASKNNIYVLDMDMDVVGKLEGIAPGQ